MPQAVVEGLKPSWGHPCLSPTGSETSVPHSWVLQQEHTTGTQECRRGLQKQASGQLQQRCPKEEKTPGVGIDRGEGGTRGSKGILPRNGRTGGLSGPRVSSGHAWWQPPDPGLIQSQGSSCSSSTLHSHLVAIQSRPPLPLQQPFSHSRLPSNHIPLPKTFIQIQVSQWVFSAETSSITSLVGRIKTQPSKPNNQQWFGQCYGPLEYFLLIPSADP